MKILFYRQWLNIVVLLLLTLSLSSCSLLIDIVHFALTSLETTSQDSISKLDSVPKLDSKIVTLLVTGEGITKEDATKVALRSAIEQAFGTFVSSNTRVLNDDLVKDEVATVASGNIYKYKEVSAVDLGETKVVNIEAVVSIDNLVSFAKSKGMKAELAGATFAMNVKMKQLNKKNEWIAVKNLLDQLNMMAEELNLFDYKLDVGEPYIAGDNYGVNVTVNVIPNENAVTFFELYERTLKSLAVSETEVAELEKMRLGVASLFISSPFRYSEIYLRNRYFYEERYEERIVRTGLIDNLVTLLHYPLIASLSKCIIEDNLKNQVRLFLISQPYNYGLNYNYEFLDDDKLHNAFGITKYSNVIVGRLSTGYNLLKYTMMGNNLYRERFLLALKSNGIGCSLNREITKIDSPITGGSVQYQNSLPILFFHRGNVGVPYELFRFSIDLFYSPDEFSKLSSIQIYPTSEVVIK